MAFAIKGLQVPLFYCIKRNCVELIRDIRETQIIRKIEGSRMGHNFGPIDPRTQRNPLGSGWVVQLCSCLLNDSYYVQLLCELKAIRLNAFVYRRSS